MAERVKGPVIATGTAVATFVLVALATAGSGASPPGSDPAPVAVVDPDPAGVPEGPFIDFCPTREQIGAHLEKYGFDYKPTVGCGELGQEVPQAEVLEAPTSERDLFAAEKERLATATRAPDADGDPLTVELVLLDGTRMTLVIQGDPGFYKDKTPAELAELLYP